MVVLSSIAQIMDPRDGDFDWSDEHGKPATLIKTCERCGKVIKGKERYCEECREDPMMATFD